MADPSLTVDAERQAATILDSLDYGILAVEGEKRIAFVNRVAEGILKLTREELLGMPLDEVLKTPRNSRWLVYDPDRVGTEEFQRVRRVKDGNRVILRSRTVPLRDADGAVVGSAAIFTEAPDDPEEVLHTDRDRLISLGELSASVAHEIRNPLTGIRTTVQFVQSKLDPGDTRREDLQDVISELDRIDQIITELLLFARPQPVRSTPIEVNPLMDRILDSLASRCEEASIAVKRVYADNLPLVHGDADLLGQVFFNVVTNAIEAMVGEEEGELKVTTTVRRSSSGKQRVNIFVSDTGCGIPEKNLEKIFDPFFTTRSLGTGLGLSISLQIVRAHGGNITPRNRRRGGATFRVSLAALPPAALPAEEPEP
jgi:PAS domain S-box-containing protein